MNSIHASGVGLDGKGGQPFFDGTDATTIAVDPVLTSPNGTSHVAAARMYVDPNSPTGYSSATGDSSNALALANLSGGAVTFTNRTSTVTGTVTVGSDAHGNQVITVDGGSLGVRLTSTRERPCCTAAGSRLPTPELGTSSRATGYAGPIETSASMGRVRRMTATSSSSPPAAQGSNPAGCCIHFPEGLVGCGSWKTFVLLTDQDQDLPVGVLQCLDEPGVALIVTDPALVQPGYTAVLTAEDRKALGLRPTARPVLYSTLTVASDGTITANLLGPLAINAQTRQGRQLVLSDASYSARHPVGAIKADSCSS